MQITRNKQPNKALSYSACVGLHCVLHVKLKKTSHPQKHVRTHARTHAREYMRTLARIRRKIIADPDLVRCTIASLRRDADLHFVSEQVTVAGAGSSYDNQ